MFSFLAQMFRWSLILAIAAGMTLAAFFLTLRYEGAGRFQISLKPKPGLEGTIVVAGQPRALRMAAAPTSPGARIPAKRTVTRRLRTAKGAVGCAAIRGDLDRAVAAYNRKMPMPMTSLDIFSLLDAEVLRNLPNCPVGGSYRRAAGGRVACSLH